jgi:hypothetical protein
MQILLIRISLGLQMLSLPLLGVDVSFGPGVDA